MNSFWCTARSCVCLSRIFVYLFLFLSVFKSIISNACSEPTGGLRAEAYELDVLSGRNNENPRISGLWATGQYLSTPFRVQLPPRFIQVGKLKVFYRWSAGTQWAGISERVELRWRTLGRPWQSVFLGQGFRDPTSGQLLLFPAHLNLDETHVGTLELKFFLWLQNGEVVEDGAYQPPMSFRVFKKSIQNSLVFRSDWKTAQTGRLTVGNTFEIFYDCERLVRQINLGGDEPSPWSIVAHVQFDDEPVEEYPLVVFLGGNGARVLSYVPTVAIPEQARRMSVWFLAFHDSRSYFDSNFGLNFNFDLLSSYATSANIPPIVGMF